MTEFWNELMTKASWEKLQELTKEFDFTLIGGWAVFLWTNKHKSKDIDIIVDYNTLSKLNEEFRLDKNDRLKRYEVKLEDLDIDVYLPYYSKLAIPIENLEKYVVRIKGMKTLNPEVLLILKQAAEKERRNSVKGQKDSIDILTIIMYSDFDLKKYSKVIKEQGLENYIDELITVIKSFDPKDSRYLDVTFKAFVDWRKNYVNKLRNLR